MALSLLAIVQEFCRRTGMPVPTGVQSNGDKGVQQMLGLMNELCEDIETRKAYQQNTFETTFVSVAAEDQGAIDTICPYGYDGDRPGHSLRPHDALAALRWPDAGFSGRRTSRCRTWARCTSSASGTIGCCSARTASRPHDRLRVRVEVGCPACSDAGGAQAVLDPRYRHFRPRRLHRHQLAPVEVEG
jgi:hypothetical protein